MNCREGKTKEKKFLPIFFGEKQNFVFNRKIYDKRKTLFLKTSFFYNIISKMHKTAATSIKLLIF